jgi:Tfp pilus assembly protein PilF
MTTPGRVVGSMAAIVGGALALAACGGSSPPAQSAQSPAGSSADTQSLASDTPPPKSEPPASAELKAGIKAFDAGNFADARASLEIAVKKAPANYEAQYDLGLACEKLGDLPAAETAYKAAIAAKPDFDTASTELSAIYTVAGRTDEAIAVARAGLSKSPSSAGLHENLAVALAGKGDQDGATAEFSQAVKLSSGDAMLHLTFAHWLNTWHVRGAAPHLDAARDLAGGDLAMVASIGHEYRMAGEFDSCVKTFDHAVQIKDGGEVRTERALCKLGLKDEKGMLDDLQAAVAKEPTYAPAHYYLAGRLAKNKKFKEAAAEYGRYLEIEPNGSLARQATERQKAAQDAAKKK